MKTTNNFGLDLATLRTRRDELGAEHIARDTQRRADGRDDDSFVSQKVEQMRETELLVRQ